MRTQKGRLVASLLLCLGGIAPGCGGPLLEGEAAGPEAPAGSVPNDPTTPTTPGATPAPADPKPAPDASAGPKAGPSSCPVFPADSAWNRDISADPVDPGSSAMIAAMNGGTRLLHPDFGSDPGYGIPWVSVPGTQPRVPMSFSYADESDPGPYPFPANAPVEPGDGHVIAIDRDNCKLYETYASSYVGPGWRADSGAVFDLRSNTLRPEGWTSADAAGLPIFPGLVRRDEILGGEIRHALRFTVQRTRKGYVHPATHFASSNTDASLPPMGARVRLKASFDLSGFSGPARVILTALKKYGMFLADNGSDWYISGERNTAWNDDELAQLKRVPASAFEVVKLGTVYNQ